MTRRSFRGSHRRWRYRYHPSGHLTNLYKKTTEVRGTSLKLEYRGQRRGYDSAKANSYQGKNSRVLKYARPVNNNPPKDPVDRKESDMSIDTQPGEEFMQ